MVRVEVRLPIILQKVGSAPRSVQLQASTVRQALRELERLYPRLDGRLTDTERQPNRFLIVFLGDLDVRALEGLDTELNEGEVLSLLPAMAGGVENRISCGV
jgi:molybdopterin synthase sulfur carrier subunit